MPGTSTSTGVALTVKWKAVIRRRRGGRRFRGAGRQRRDAGHARQRSQDPFRAGRQVGDPDTGRIRDRRDHGRRPDIHRQLADTLGAVGTPSNGASTRIVVIRGASSEVGMM